MTHRGRAAILLGSLLLCGCSLIASPQVSWRWEGTATFTLGSLTPREIVLVMTETDGSITGSLEWSEAYTSPVTEVTGSRADSRVEIEAMVHGSLMTLEGALDGGTMAGTCTYRGVTDAWEVTRVS